MFEAGGRIAMSARPIKKHLLKHAATLKPWTGTTDRNGVKTFGTSIDLKSVRFEPAKRSVLNDLGEFKNDRFLMFYDVRNSLPKGTTFNKGDEIVFLSSTLTIRDFELLYADDADPHHWEIYLT